MLTDDLDEHDYDDDLGVDLGTCPYFARWRSTPGPFEAQAVCGFDCVDEPECVTCEPVGGWPSVTGVPDDDLATWLASVRDEREAVVELPAPCEHGRIGCCPTSKAGE